MPKALDGVRADTLLSGLEAAKQAKLAEINAVFESLALSVTAAYPEHEKLTFDQQIQEARAYLADASTPCPLLSPLASARVISLDVLCQRVLAKHAAYSAAMGTLLGQRQGLEDMLDACDSVADVQAITENLTLPAQGAD